MSNAYDNFSLNQLKQTNKETLHMPKVKTIQNTFNPSTSIKDKKRKSSPDIQRVALHKGNSKNSSQSIPEIYFKNHYEINVNVSQQEFGSNETLKAAGEEKPNDICDESKKFTNIQSTTAVLDDGYESSNSTPLVSGKFFC